jgi:prepilin-type N-terminal cleavage/methylation domain-containing protein
MKRFAFTLVELLVVLAVLAILAALLFPLFAKAREKARTTSCLTHQRQIAAAVAMYVQDYDETFPPDDQTLWSTKLKTYNDASLYDCPTRTGRGTNAAPDYAFNGALFGVRLSTVADPTRATVSADALPDVTVLRAGADADPRHLKHVVAAFVDGHADLRSAGGLLAPVAAGRLFACGENNAGQVGDGTLLNTRYTPCRVAGLDRAVMAAAGQEHSLALTSDGSVYAWGVNLMGELGDPTLAIPANRCQPQRIANLANIIAISAGSHFNLALDATGHIMAWGDNGDGELGDGSDREHSATPVTVNGLHEIVAIAAGGIFALALASDGQVFAWGDNSLGQLGDGTTVQRRTPVPVTGLCDVVAITAGGNWSTGGTHHHSLAVTRDGSVYAWGSNYAGQLGDGTRTSRLTPVKVPGISGVVAVSAGQTHSLAITRDGQVYAWGANDNSELGDGTTTDRYTPVPVAGLNDAVAISAGIGFSLALTRSGEVYGWGGNGNGEFGEGAPNTYPTPVRISSLKHVIAAHTGSDAIHSLFIRR